MECVGTTTCCAQQVREVFPYKIDKQPTILCGTFIAVAGRQLLKKIQATHGIDSDWFDVPKQYTEFTELYKHHSLTHTQIKWENEAGATHMYAVDNRITIRDNITFTN